MCVLQTDRGYRRTWQVNTDCQEEILAPGNIEDYCESTLTFPRLCYCHSFWPSACGAAAATAVRHDCGRIFSTLAKVS